MHFSRKKNVRENSSKKNKKSSTPIVFEKIYSQNAKFARNFASFWHFSLHSIFALKCENWRKSLQNTKENFSHFFAKRFVRCKT